MTEDGAETDLDLGHYERFTGRPATKSDQYHHRPDLHERPAKGAPGGLSRRDRAQVIPHITDEIKAFIREKDGTADFVLVEIGVARWGISRACRFFEAIRQFGNEVGRQKALFIRRDAAALYSSAWRTENQADPAFGERTDERRDQAPYPALPGGPGD